MHGYVHGFASEFGCVNVGSAGLFSRTIIIIITTVWL
jgi:hypothetical protein